MSEDLTKRIASLESELAGRNAQFSGTLSDIFTSIPARATSIESGAVSPLPPSLPVIDLSFRRHYDAPPRFVGWLVLRDDSPHSTLPAAIRLRRESATVTTRSATVNVGDFATSHPRSQLFWFAYTLSRANAGLSALVSRIFASPSLTPQLLADIEALLASGVDINEGDATGATLLHAASVNGTIPLVEFLLSKGAAVDASDEQGWTPFLSSLAASQPAASLTLIEHGASLTATCERGQSALHVLCRWRNFSESQSSLAKLLVTRGCDPNELNDAAETPLLYLMKRRTDNSVIPLVSVLLKLGANPRIPDTMGVAPVHLAAALESTELAQLLVDYGADPTILGPNGSAIAIAKSNKAMTRVLVPDPQIHDVPSEVLELILRFLPPRDLMHVMLVSRYFRKVATAVSDDPSYWMSSVGMLRERFVAPRKFVLSVSSRLGMYMSGVSDFVAPPPVSSPQAPTPLPDSTTPQVTRLLFTVAGTKSCGKSSFMHRFCGETKMGGNFPSNRATKTASPFSTERSFGRSRRRPYEDGVEMKKRPVLLRGKHAEIVLVEMPDAHQVFYSFWRHSSGCIVLLDLGRQDAVEMMRQYVTQWRSFCNEGKEDRVIIVGSKGDLPPEERKVSLASAQFAAAELQLPYIETSAKYGTNVDAAVKVLAELTSEAPITAVPQHREKRHARLPTVTPSRSMTYDRFQAPPATFTETTSPKECADESPIKKFMEEGNCIIS